MDIRFVAPTLRAIDGADGELFACCIWQDERPFSGVPAIIDWLLAAKLARAARSGILTGALGEVMMTGGRPRIGFEKVVVFGAGERAKFSEQVFCVVVAKMVACFHGISLRQATLSLPGRFERAIAADRAIEFVLEAASSQSLPSLCVVEEEQGMREMESRVQEFARRRRRLSST